MGIEIGLGITIGTGITLTPGPPLVPGDAFGGGFYAGQIGVSGVATHNLIVAPLSSGEATLYWSNANSTDPAVGAASVIDGPQNTADIVAAGNSTVYPAAHFCNDLVTGGFSDWYLPATNEQEVCYYNLKPNSNFFDNGAGINPNAIPPRASAYTNGNPARTSAVAFQSGGSEAYNPPTTYWTSTKATGTYARIKNFSYGGSYQQAKPSPNIRLRAIRRIAV